MMRKRIVTLAAAFVLAFSAVAAAAGVTQINSDDHVLQSTEIALGGIMVGTPRSEVEAIYGAPTERTEPVKSAAMDEMMDTYTYGTSFQVIFVKDMAMFIISTANNGIATPAGVTVGDPADAVMRTYGKPHRYSRSESGNESFVYLDPYGIAIVFSAEDGSITRIGIVGYE